MKRALLLCATAGVFAIANPAFAIYKCVANGAVTYSDAPCPGGKPLDIGESPPHDAADAQRRAASEKQTLARIESERRKQEAKEETARRKSARAHASLERKCAALERRRKWAAEDAASATGKSVEKAKRKARRAAELFEAECRA